MQHRIRLHEEHVDLIIDRCVPVYYVTLTASGPGPNDLTPFVVGVCVAWLGTGIRVCSDVILSHKRNGNYVSKGRGMILFRFMK